MGAAEGALQPLFPAGRERTAATQPPGLFALVSQPTWSRGRRGDTDGFVGIMAALRGRRTVRLSVGVSCVWPPTHTDANERRHGCCIMSTLCVILSFCGASCGGGRV